MPDPMQTDPYDDAPPEILCKYPALPRWLGRRLLRPGEEIAWVRGPRLNPWWERYATHPALFLAALALGAACLAAGRLLAGSWSQITPLPVLAAGTLAVGSIFVLGISAGYFTRLVVTNLRVVMLQGYETRRSWSLDELPRSLIRYGRRDGGRRSRAVDLEALQTMLGDATDQYTESKTILAFAKQLDQIKTRKDGHP